MHIIEVRTSLGPRRIAVTREIDRDLLEASADPEALALAEFLIAWRTVQLETESYRREMMTGRKADAGPED